MKKYLLILLLWIFCSPITYANNTNKSQLRDPKAYEKELTKILKSLHSITSVPGFSMAVTHKGKLITSVGTGFTDLKNNQQVKPDTTFRLASVSKIIGATMLAELVVNGQLDPDKPISHYYPELDKKYHSITIRQLLSHSSGMPHYQSKDYDIYDSHFTSAIDAVKTLKNRDLLSRPGTQYVYSTHGYTLAGALYEKITKQPLSVSINNFITRWTGQASPAIENINALGASSSKLFKLNSHGVKEIPYGEKSYSVFGAGLYATASDLALFGAKVLEKSKLDESFQHLLFTPTKLSDGKFISSRGFKVGFGWRISKDSQGRMVYHHAGATPGARSVLAIFPEQEISIAFLSNSSWISSIEN
jgi:CubicO group peptidase (beta-lactamase class C family)